MFINAETASIDQYWADPYLQHNPVAKSGLTAFKGFFGSASTLQGLGYKILRVVAHCDLVAVHGSYASSGVVFDMLRVKDKHFVEHWDSDANQASDAKGETEPAVPDTVALTEVTANLVLVQNYFTEVLVGADRDGIEGYFATDFVDHRNASSSGSAAYLSALETDKVTYTKVHYALADADLVFVLSEGKRNTANFGFYELFRIAGGKLAERWDSRRSVPAGTTQSGLPIF